MKHQHLHHKTHQGHGGVALPHLNEALASDTGKPDVNALKAGAAAWWDAIDRGEYEIVSATEIGVDDDTDVLVIARKKVAK